MVSSSYKAAVCNWWSAVNTRGRNKGWPEREGRDSAYGKRRAAWKCLLACLPRCSPFKCSSNAQVWRPVTFDALWSNSISKNGSSSSRVQHWAEELTGSVQGAAPCPHCYRTTPYFCKMGSWSIAADGFAPISIPIVRVNTLFLGHIAICRSLGTFMFKRKSSVKIS